MFYLYNNTSISLKSETKVQPYYEIKKYFRIYFYAFLS